MQDGNAHNKNKKRRITESEEEQKDTNNEQQDAIDQLEFFTKKRINKQGEITYSSHAYSEGMLHISKFSQRNSSKPDGSMRTWNCTAAGCHGAIKTKGDTFHSFSAEHDEQCNHTVQQMNVRKVVATERMKQAV